MFTKNNFKTTDTAEMYFYLTYNARLEETEFWFSLSDLTDVLYRKAYCTTKGAQQSF